MIKNIFLKHRGKPTTSSKEHCQYKDAKSIGILYDAAEFNSLTIHELENNLKSDGKDVAKVGFQDKPSEDPLIFDKKAISGTGSIKDNHLTFFINQPFDFLITLDISENVNLKYVLAISKATCKVGFETEQYVDLLQMSLKMESDKKQAVQSLLKYLKMI
ncbi:MAG: hypothetical protein AAFY41_01230 [Bacteroidota bacterium]